MAILTAILFIVHPVNNEVANWPVAISELTFAIFTLLAVISYIKYRKKGFGRNLFLVYLFYFLAMLSKEPAVFVVPLVIFLLDLVIFRIAIKKLFSSPELKRYALFVIPFVVYFVMRIAVLGLRGAFLMSGEHIKGFSLTERIYAFFTLFIQYLKELFFPYPLRFFHDFSLRSDLFNIPFLLSLLGVFAFFLLVYVSIKQDKRIAAFFLMWIALFFLPMLIFFDTAEMRVFFDRFFVISSIGLAFLVSYAFVSLWQLERVIRFFGTEQRVKVMVLSLVGILIVFSWMTVFPRNKVWKDVGTFYTTTLEQKPDAHFMRRELGEFYFQQGELEKAKSEFEYLIEHAPDWKDVTMAYKGMGDYYRALGDSDRALDYYQTAIDTSSNAPRDYVVYNHIGVLHMDKKEYLKGFAAFCQSLGLFSESQSVQGNFQDALAFTDTEYIQKSILGEKIREEFNESPEQKIVYQDKRCDDTSCQYAFSFQASQFEILPPFLIIGTTTSRDEVEIINKSFNPETSIIVLELDSSYQDQVLTFLFPTCQGIYYEANTDVIDTL